MPRSDEPVDLYPGPDMVWRFFERNRRPLIIIATCGVLLLVGTFVYASYWLGGCGGTDADRALVADLRDDPLMTALPPEATSAQESTTYCPRPFNPRTPARSTVKLALEITKQARLTTPMSVTDLHQYFVGSVGLSDWRLTDTGEQSLSYCRVLHPYRVVSLMTLDGEWFTNRILAWTDPRPCAAEVPSPP